MSKDTCLSDKYCEGWCKDDGGKGKFNDCTGCEIAELEAELATTKQSYTDMFDGGVENLAEVIIENANLRGRFAAEKLRGRFAAEKKQSYLGGVNAGMERAAEIAESLYLPECHRECIEPRVCRTVAESIRKEIEK